MVYPMLLHRKIENQTDIKNANDYLTKYNNIDDLYKNSTFGTVNKVIGDYYEDVQKEVVKLRKFGNFKSLDFNNPLIKKYYNGNEKGTLNISHRKLDYILEVEEKNREMLNWVDFPYSVSYMDFNQSQYAGLVELLNKVMVF